MTVARLRQEGGNVKEIKLNRLSLRDFQGGTVTLDAGGKDAFIFAANAAGKTRLVSAFSWVLFNKDALGRSDFEIKNLDEMGEPAHNLEHTVEAELTVNGKPVTLKKVYKEKWTKKRGSAAREFSGHTTEYFVDGVPIQEKDYIYRISQIAGDESRFRLLTSPTAFPALHWQKQRQLLLDICGDISDADIIESDERLSDLPGILAGHSLNDYRKIIAARRSEINKEMERIPVRIDEVNRSLPDVTGIDREAVEQKARDVETILNDAQLRLQGMDTGGNIADLTRTLTSTRGEIQKLQADHRSESLSTLNSLNQDISEIETRLVTASRRIQAIDGDLKAKEGRVKTMDADLARLRDRWMAVDAETFRDTTSDTCPTCRQVLPADRVREARDKALASFNENKAERLGDIHRKGVELKADRDRLAGEVEGLWKEREVVGAAAPEAEAKLNELRRARDTLKKASEDFSVVPGYEKLLADVAEIEEQIKAERQGKAQDSEKIKVQIAALQAELAAAKSRADAFTRREQGEKRIEELKAEEKKLAAEFEKLERELYLCELFIKAKVAMLTERINGKFEMVRFKLFNSLINGGIEDCCEITVNGIPFNAGLNNAARIQAGLDIIRTLQAHFEMKAPVFCDNRESVSEIPAMGCQVVSLVVSPEDKTLRVETQGTKYGKAA